MVICMETIVLNRERMTRFQGTLYIQQHSFVLRRILAYRCQDFPFKWPYFHSASEIRIAGSMHCSEGWMKATGRLSPVGEKIQRLQWRQPDGRHLKRLASLLTVTTSP